MVVIPIGVSFLSAVLLVEKVCLGFKNLVIFPSGLNGPTVVLHAAEVYKHERETAPIPFRNTKEKTVKAWAPLSRHSHAARKNAVSTKLCTHASLV